MIPSLLIKHKHSQIMAIMQRFPVQNPKVFGSIAKGIDNEQSDLDLLIEPLPQMTMLDLCGLQIELEELLGMHVDILTPRSIPEKFRNQVLAEAKPL